MLTPLFQEDQKLFAGFNSELGNKYANSMNVFRADAAGAASLRVHEQSTPDLTLYVEPGKNIFINDTNIDFAGGNTPSFSVPGTGSRTDLVTIDNTGTINIHQGVSGVNNYPSTERALAEVLLVAGDTSISDNRITDVRQFFGAGIRPNAMVTTNKTGAQASNTPTNTVFSIDSGSYIVGTGATQVYVDGIRKVLGDDYTETSSTTITLVDPITDTQKVSIIVNQAQAFEVSSRVAKAGDTMTGDLTVPKVIFNVAGNMIYSLGSDLMFDDGNNTPKSLTDLTVSAGLTVNHEEFVASSSQTVFNLSFAYGVGTNKLQVFANGLLQREGAGDDYVETDSTTITFNSGLIAGTKVTVHAVV